MPMDWRLRHWPIRPYLIDKPYADKAAKEALIGAHIGMEKTPCATPEDRNHPVHPHRFIDIVVETVAGRAAATRARAPDVFGPGTIPSQEVIEALLAPVDRLLDLLRHMRGTKAEDPDMMQPWMHQPALAHMDKLGFIVPFIPEAQWRFAEAGFARREAGST